MRALEEMEQRHRSKKGQCKEQLTLAQLIKHQSTHRNPPIWSWFRDLCPLCRTRLTRWSTSYKGDMGGFSVTVWHCPTNDGYEYAQ